MKPTELIVNVPDEMATEIPRNLLNFPTTGNQTLTALNINKKNGNLSRYCSIQKPCRPSTFTRLYSGEHVYYTSINVSAPLFLSVSFIGCAVLWYSSKWIGWAWWVSVTVFRECWSWPIAEQKSYMYHFHMGRNFYYVLEQKLVMMTFIVPVLTLMNVLHWFICSLSEYVLQGFTCSRVQTFTKTKIQRLIGACRRRAGRRKVVLKETQVNIKNTTFST